MAQTIEFFYDVFSPHSYLASVKLPEFQKRTGANVIYRPYNHAEVTRLANNPTAMTIPKKLQYLVTEIGRTVAESNIPFGLPSFFPFDSKALQCLLVSAEKFGGQAKLSALTDKVYAALWGRGEDVRTWDALRPLVASVGLEAGPVIDYANSADASAKLQAVTQEASDRGAFGSPTFFWGKEMYWGHDRLPAIERAILAAQK